MAKGAGVASSAALKLGSGQVSVMGKAPVIPTTH